MRLVIVEPALDEADSARRYYANINGELGERFAGELQRSIEWIVEQPMAWAPIGRRARRRLLNRFPYAVVYRIEADLIRVLAVMHLRRRPGYWRGR